MPQYPFWKITPSGNPTILLRAEDIPTEYRAAVARAVMDDQHIGGEQVGYIRLSGIPRMDMMGGEFCLNATRAFATLLHDMALLPRTDHGSAGTVEVSGARGPVAVRVTTLPDGQLFTEACLHFTALPQPETLQEGALLVRVPGITHILQEGAPPQHENLSNFCTEQRRRTGTGDEDAVGHLWFSRAHDQQEENIPTLHLHPVVWVKNTASLCSESACGSGTLACALAEFSRTGALNFSVVQPSGIPLSVRFENEGSGWNVWVGGPVRITARGETNLSGLL